MSGAGDGGGGGGGGGGGAVNPWLVNESEETRGLSFGEIKQQQHSIMEGQSRAPASSPSDSGTLARCRSHYGSGLCQSAVGESC